MLVILQKMITFHYVIVFLFPSHVEANVLNRRKETSITFITFQYTTDYTFANIDNFWIICITFHYVIV